MALNMGTFEALDNSELFAVDGGRPAAQWIEGACAVTGLIVGGVAGYVVGNAAGAYAGAKWGRVIGFAAGTAVTIVVSKVIRNIYYGD